MRLGWRFSDPELLNAVGSVSGQSVPGIALGLIPTLEGLHYRFALPSATFLDIGCGAGEISIGMCRHFPNVRVIGLELQDAPLAEARRNVAAAGLENRIELRQQLVEEISDSEAYDSAFFPQMFMSDEVVRRALEAIWRALLPGGWLVTATRSMSGPELLQAVSRLNDALWGGGCRPPEVIAGMMCEAGFEGVRAVLGEEGTSGAVVGRRPM